jgi:NAD(P)-dependent dehydrogenase (short-subunit alcohol dehydrogenase family)
MTGPGKPLLESDESAWDMVFAVNVTAPYLLIKRLGSHLVARGAPGRIVNITSSSAHRARMSIPAYGASKSALMQLTRTAAADLGPHDINVNAVAPGLTATQMGTGSFPAEMVDQIIKDGPISNLLGRVSQPEDVADAVLFLCLPASRQITGQTVHVSAGAII